MIEYNKDRYRTLKVYDTKITTKLSNGDILFTKELLGRITVVTVPLDDTNKEFLVDFSFCSRKDKYNKKYGQNLAYNRLVEKIDDNESNVYSITLEDGDRMLDVIKDIIISEFSDVISWLHNINKENIV